MTVPIEEAMAKQLKGPPDQSPFAYWLIGVPTAVLGLLISRLLPGHTEPISQRELDACRAGAEWMREGYGFSDLEITDDQLRRAMRRASSKESGHDDEQS